jgi:hypothetical protein
LIGQYNMVGIQTMIFALHNVKNSISDVEFDYVRCGFAKKLGNKGSVVVRFCIYDTSVCVINCHLKHG